MILGFFVVMPMISLRFVDQLGWAAGVVGLALGLRQLTQQGLGCFGGSLADKFGARPSSSAACCCGRWGLPA